MARQQTPQDILAAARQRNEDRMAAVERLVGERGTRAGIAAAEQALAEAIAKATAKVDEAKAADARAYAEAVKAGWTAAELRAVGIRPLDAKPAPAKASSSRPSRSAARRADEAIVHEARERQLVPAPGQPADAEHQGEPVGADA